jgi:hypothetical protein
MRPKPRKSPEEIASERKPLEEELSAADAEIQEVHDAIPRTTDPESAAGDTP